MSNHLFIDTIRVSFLVKAPATRHDLYVWWVGDDYTDFPVVDFRTAKEVPKTIEAVLRHLYTEDSRAYELIGEHVQYDKGVEYNGT